MNARERRRPGLWVVVPAWNEARTIGTVVRGLAEHLPRVVVVDDGSTDRCGEIALAEGATVMRHAINLGQGAALQSGIAYALSRNASHIATFDADGQHDPASIADLRAALDASGADVALGSRFLHGTPRMPALRRFVLQAAVRLTRAQTGLALTDAHNGLRVFTRDAAARLEIRQPGMAHASEILATIARAKLRHVEVPTTVSYSEYSLQKGQRIGNSVKILFDMMYAAWTR
jgi:glycosyltransferase involved in cell wall biosynthesis